MATVAPRSERPVPFGPRDYRRRIRTRGPLVALAPSAAAGLVSLLLLWGNTAAWRGVGAVALSLFAAPVLLAVGAPLTGGTLLLAGIALSAVLWLGLGALAAHRATRRPAVAWREFWVQYMWLAGGVWIGVVAALVIANLVLGSALL